MKGTELYKENQINVKWFEAGQVLHRLVGGGWFTVSEALELPFQKLISKVFYESIKLPPILLWQVANANSAIFPKYFCAGELRLKTRGAGTINKLRSL